MNRNEKIQALLVWNKKNHSTFQERASIARQILSADDAGLDFMMDAAGI